PSSLKPPNSRSSRKSKHSRRLLLRRRRHVRKRPLLKPAQRPAGSAPNAADPEIQTETARYESAEQKHDHADVPRRPAVVPERKIETVKAVVQPTLDSIEPMNRREHLAVLRIDIDPSLHRIGKLHSQDRQRRHAAARIIIGVIIRNELLL